MSITFRQSMFVAACLVGLVANRSVRAQSAGDTAIRKLALGFAVDTTVVPGGWWGVDTARASLREVVRAWRDYLVVRHDQAQRPAFWSAADRLQSSDPDPLMPSESYLLDGQPLLIEALPLVAGNPDRWLLRTVYVGGGTAVRPGLLGMERT